MRGVGALVALVLAPLLLPGGSASAQQAAAAGRASVEGIRVRFSGADGVPTTATLVSMDANRTVLLLPSRAEPLEVPTATLQRFEVSLGPQRRVRQAVIYSSLAVGIGSGLVTALTWKRERECTVSEAICLNAAAGRREQAFRSTLAGAAWGLPLGLVIGLLDVRERWTEVEVSVSGAFAIFSSLELAPPAGDGVGVQASLRLVR